MNDRYKYILSTLENKYTVDAVFRENEKSRIVSYADKENEANKIVLIVTAMNKDSVLKKLIGVSCDYLPKVYDYCTDGEETLILEEYITGIRLSDILSQKDIDKSRAVGYAVNICDALDFLHSRKIVHRDIKPSNVIIDTDDKAVLIDLQTARNISEERNTDTNSLGTVGYAAPEQYGIVQSMPATDIYALGVMLNEMLINEHPSVKIPDGKLGKIVEKCTHTVMSKRYQSVSELKKDLKKYSRFHR